MVGIADWGEAPMLRTFTWAHDLAPQSLTSRVNPMLWFWSP